MRYYKVKMRLWSTTSFRLGKGRLQDIARGCDYDRLGAQQSDCGCHRAFVCSTTRPRARDEGIVLPCTLLCDLRSSFLPVDRWTLLSHPLQQWYDVNHACLQHQVLPACSAGSTCPVLANAMRSLSHRIAWLVKSRYKRHI